MPLKKKHEGGKELLLPKLVKLLSEEQSEVVENVGDGFGFIQKYRSVNDPTLGNIPLFTQPPPEHSLITHSTACVGMCVAQS